MGFTDHHPGSCTTARRAWPPWKGATQLGFQLGRVGPRGAAPLTLPSQRPRSGDLCRHLFQKGRARQCKAA